MVREMPRRDPDQGTHRDAESRRRAATLPGRVVEALEKGNIRRAEMAQLVEIGWQPGDELPAPEA